MKLDQRRIHLIIQQKQKGVATKQIAQDMKISLRRVQQIWKSYAEGKQEPAIGENMGRPRKPFDEKEAQVVGEAYTLCRFGARILEVALGKVFKIRISHNRIHMYLKAAGLAHEDPQKKKRRKWMRQEMYFAIGHKVVRTMSRNMNYSHEMKLEQVRNTFGTLQELTFRKRLKIVEIMVVHKFVGCSEGYIGQSSCQRS